METAGQLAQLVDRCPGVRRRGIELDKRVRVGVGTHPAPEELERDPERDESLLGAVVEIALDPATLGILGVDEAGARCLNRVELRPDLGLEPLVLDRQADRRDSRRHEARVVAEDGVEGDREERASVGIDGQRRPCRAVRRRRGERAGRVLEAGAVRHPAEDLERWVAERVAQRLLESGCRWQPVEPDDQRRDPTARCVVAQDPDEQRDRHEDAQDREDDDAQLADGRTGIGRDDRLDEEPAGEPEDEEDARQDDRRLPAPCGSRGALPADRDGDEDAETERGKRRRLDPADRLHRIVRRDPRIDRVGRRRVRPPGDRPGGVNLGQRPGALDDDETERQPAVHGTRKRPVG